MRLLVWLLLVHLLVYMGLDRREAVGARLLGYPEHLAGLLSWEVLGTWLPALGLTALYLGGSIGLAWALLPALRRAPGAALWAAGGLPPFVLMMAVVLAVLRLSGTLGAGVPLEPTSPWLVATVCGALALPAAGRAALLKRRLAELEAADFSRTARGMGLPETRVRAKAARVALPEGVALLAGEALGLAAGLMLLEGLLQFPGLANAAYGAFAGLFGTSASVDPAVLALAVANASAPVLLLLLLAGTYALALDGLARRLDPRGRP